MSCVLYIFVAMGAYLSAYVVSLYSLAVYIDPQEIDSLMPHLSPARRKIVLKLAGDPRALVLEATHTLREVLPGEYHAALHAPIFVPQPDLAVANSSSSNVGVLLGNGTGGFAAAVAFASGGSNPFAVIVADLLAAECDFFSIGTNDLLQYYLAVDRSNEHVSYLYKPLHPAALRLLKHVIASAIRHGKDVALCGEMAADPLHAMILLGLELRTFSMNPIFIPRVKQALRAVEVRTVRRVVQQALNLRSAQEVEEFVIEKLLPKYPDAFLMTGAPK